MISAPAGMQADRIDRWWRKNRPASPGVFALELAEAWRFLAATPELGPIYVQRHGVLVRRVLLRKSKNHVYYEIDRTNDHVMILAVWGGPKGRGPAL
jgi:hypothetical protein